MASCLKTRQVRLQLEMETSTVASYYLLFRSEYQRKEQSKEKLILDGSNDIYREYEWTEDDSKEAVQILNENPEARNAKFHSIIRYEKEAAKNWDKFYTRNQSNFFKDRHYLTEVFPELAGKNDASDEAFVLLEVGCGVGVSYSP